MKKAVVACLLFALAGTSGLLASKHSKSLSIENEKYEVINLSELTERLSKGISKDKFQNIILECPAGVELPLNLKMTGDLFSLGPQESAVYTLKLLRPCFIKCRSKKSLLFSTDLQNWKHFSEFFTGKTNASLDLQNYFPAANLELELHQQD